MIFFPRSHVGICHEGGRTSYPINNFEILDNFIIVDKKSGQSYSLYSLLREEIACSEQGIFSAFSNAMAFKELQLKAGYIERVSLAEIKSSYHIPETFIGFIVKLPTAIMGNQEKSEHCFPSIFQLKDDWLLISAVSHNTAPRDTIFPLWVNIYFHKEITDAWQEVLYKSLFELSQKDFNISLLLLFSAIDILTRNLCEKYTLNQNSRIDARLKELSHIIENKTILKAAEFCKFKKKFDKKVTTPRNDFEHAHKVITYQEIQDAYLATFDVLWYLSRLDLN